MSDKVNDLMSPYEIRDSVSTHAPFKDQLLVRAEPIYTSKGRHMLEMQANAYLDREQVLLLRNWLNDWLGSTNPNPHKPVITFRNLNKE